MTPEQDIQAKIRKVLQHHNLTKHGDGVVEGDLMALKIQETESLKAQLVIALGAGEILQSANLALKAVLAANAPTAPSPTTGMTLEQRILHVGGRNNAAGYVEFGSTQAVQALIAHVLRDLPVAANAGQTPEGWPPGMLQDDDSALHKWLARRACCMCWHRAAIGEQR